MTLNALESTISIASSLLIHYLLRRLTMNTQSSFWFYEKSTVILGSSLSIHCCSLSVSHMNYAFTICFATELWIHHFARIHLESDILSAKLLKSPNRNNPTIASPWISGESKKSGYSLRKSRANFLPQVFRRFRKTRGKPYIDFMCVLFKVKKVSMDRLGPVNV